MSQSNSFLEVRWLAEVKSAYFRLLN